MKLSILPAIHPEYTLEYNPTPPRRMVPQTVIARIIWGDRQITLVIPPNALIRRKKTFPPWQILHLLFYEHLHIAPDMLVRYLQELINVDNNIASIKNLSIDLFNGFPLNTTTPIILTETYKLGINNDITLNDIVSSNDATFDLYVSSINNSIVKVKIKNGGSDYKVNDIIKITDSDNSINYIVFKVCTIS